MKNKSPGRCLEIQNVVGVFWLAALLMFLFFRLLIYFSYPGIFNFSLISLKNVYLWTEAVRFDLASVTYFYFIPTLAVFIPGLKSVKLNKAAVWWFAVSFVLMFLILVVDLNYFPESKKHLGPEVLTVRTKIMFLLEYAAREKLLTVVFAFSFSAAVLYSVRVFLKKYVPVKTSGTEKQIKYFAAAVLCLFLFYRGFKIFGDPFGLPDLYDRKENTAQATFVSNGIFSVYHKLFNMPDVAERNYPLDAAIDNIDRALGSDNVIFPNQRFPLMREIRNDKKFNKYNIIVLLLESWTPEFIDSLSGGSYGVTPNFDRIVKDGVVFTNAYATGVRSIYGLYSTLMGVPLLSDIPIVTFEGGLEMNNLSSLAKELGRLGYYTLFSQTSGRGSYLMENVAEQVLYFKSTVSGSELPHAIDYNKSRTFCGYDYDMTAYFAAKAAECKKKGIPFFFFGFTGATHPPFILPSDVFRKYPLSTRFGPYLDALFYSDASVGYLIREAKEQGFLDDTVFVFIADHTLTSVQKKDEIREKFNIPFVIYAPKILGKKKVDWTVSQLDLNPTLYGILNIKKPYTYLGNDALDQTAEHYALIIDWDDILLVKDGHHVRYNGEEITDTDLRDGSPELPVMTDLLLSLDRLTAQTLHTNKWYLP